MGSLLEVRDISVRYGGIRAVDDLSMSVESGAIVGLIGPNGAGKTTFVDALSGFVPCEGQILLGGRPLQGCAPHVRVRRGMGRTFQSLELFDDLTVAENIMAATGGHGVGAFLSGVLWPRRAGGSESADWAIATLGLGGVAERRVSELSLGTRKLVAIARAIAAGPKVLLLDEPAAGLDSTESLALGVKLRGLPDQGVSVLLVDHDMALVLGTCDVIYVVDFGKVISQGTPAVVRNEPAVIEAYLGSSGDMPDVSTKVGAEDSATSRDVL